MHVFSGTWKKIAEREKVLIYRFSFQLLAAVAVSWVSMIIGYSSAYTSPAQLSLEADFHFVGDEVSLCIIYLINFIPNMLSHRIFCHLDRATAPFLNL